MKAIACSLECYGLENASERVNMGINAPAGFTCEAKWTGTTTTWRLTAMSRAQAEALTPAKIEELVAFLTCTANAGSRDAYELCLIVELEDSSTYLCPCRSATAGTAEEWEAFGGTRVEALGREVVPPEAVSILKGCLGKANQKLTAQFTCPAALKTALTGHEHTLTAANGSSAQLRHEAISRALKASQAQTPSVKKIVSRTHTSTQGATITRTAEVGRTLTSATSSSASFARSVARTLSAAQSSPSLVAHSPTRTLPTTQSSSPVIARSPARTLRVSQAQSAVRTAVTTFTKTFTVIQVSSYGPQLPETPVTDGLEEELGFNSGATWTVLAWAEAIGSVYVRNKGLAGKPKPVGWGGTETLKLGARYNAASFRDPINRMAIRESDSRAERFAAIGICVPSGGERSGYVARIEAQGEGVAIKVFLERWVNGVKTVLAETTIESGYFGASTTGKAAPFALTLVGGVLRLWLAKSLGAPTVLLSATDATFASGYNTMESAGNWMLSQEHAATMDGQIAMQLLAAKGQALSTTQASSITRAPTQVARTLSVGQASSASFARALARTLSTAQGSTAQVLRALARALTTSQGSSATRTATLTRTLTTTQGSTISRRTEIARTLSGGVTQVALLARTLTRQLTASQDSTPTLRRELARTLSIGQAQAATHSESGARTLSTAQASASNLRAAVSRTLTAASGASATFARAIARTLRITQPQVASEEATIEAGSHGHPHTLQAAQGASAALQRALARRLAASQGSGATLARAISRTLATSGGASASVGRALPKTLSTSSTSLASVGRTQVAAHLTVMSPSHALMSARVGRALSATQPSAALLLGEVIEVPLPPPAMIASTVIPYPGSASVEASRLTSSVGAR